MITKCDKSYTYEESYDKCGGRWTNHVLCFLLIYFIKNESILPQIYFLSLLLIFSFCLFSASRSCCLTCLDEYGFDNCLSLPFFSVRVFGSMVGFLFNNLMEGPINFMKSCIFYTDRVHSLRCIPYDA